MNLEDLQQWAKTMACAMRMQVQWVSSVSEGRLERRSVGGGWVHAMEEMAKVMSVK